MKNKAYLFDMDGLLLDSEKIYFKSWMRAGRDMGYEMSDSIVLQLRSLDKNLARKFILNYFGEDCYQPIKDRRNKIMKEIIGEEGIKAKEGAIEIIEFLKTHQKMFYIVTASDKEKAEIYLNSAGINADECIISAKEVERGKPFPDVYIKVCDILKIEPEKCLVFEDSPNGIKSAHDAGCRVIMVPDLTLPTQKELELVCSIIPDLTIAKKMLDENKL